MDSHVVSESYRSCKLFGADLALEFVLPSVHNHMVIQLTFPYKRSRAIFTLVGFFFGVVRSDVISHHRARNSRVVAVRTLVWLDTLVIIRRVGFDFAPVIFYLSTDKAKVLALGFIAVGAPFSHRIISGLPAVVNKTDLDKELVLLDFGQLSTH